MWVRASARTLPPMRIILFSQKILRESAKFSFPDEVLQFLTVQILYRGAFVVRAAMKEARTRTLFFSIPVLGIRHVRTPGPLEKYSL
jgi:hypothetical protein